MIIRIYTNYKSYNKKYIYICNHRPCYFYCSIWRHLISCPKQVPENIAGENIVCKDSADCGNHSSTLPNNGDIGWALLTYTGIMAPTKHLISATASVVLNMISCDIVPGWHSPDCPSGPADGFVDPNSANSPGAQPCEMPSKMTSSHCGRTWWTSGTNCRTMWTCWMFHGGTGGSWPFQPVNCFTFFHAKTHRIK